MKRGVREAVELTHGLAMLNSLVNSDVRKRAGRAQQEGAAIGIARAQKFNDGDDSLCEICFIHVAK